MNPENYILVSLDSEDEKSKSIAEVLSSKTSKKIINHLATTKEASQKDLSDELKIPLNTVEYNVKKLLNAGFIQKRKNFFWSKKGKKIIMYELSNKSVLISHKKPTAQKLKSLVPAFIISAVGSFALWTYQKITSVPKTIQRVLPNADDGFLAIQETAGKSADVLQPTDLITPVGTPLWLWFLVGSLLAIFIIAVVNWRKL